MIAHAVYGLYTHEHDILVYVGHTCDPWVRQKEHRKHPSVAMKEAIGLYGDLYMLPFVRFRNADYAKQLEGDLIRSERPICNRVPGTPAGKIEIDWSDVVHDYEL